MSKYNLARKVFDLEEFDSYGSEKSVIYISSSESEASDWETDCSTDTEQLIARIEREVTSSPMLIGGRVMTSEISEEDVLVAGPSTSGANAEKTQATVMRKFQQLSVRTPKQPDLYLLPARLL